MTRIPIKEEDFVDDLDFYGIAIETGKTNGTLYSHQLKQQILQDHEIVNRLNESIKEIELLKDKDTLYTGHIELIERCLPLLQKIRDGK